MGRIRQRQAQPLRAIAGAETPEPAPEPAPEPLAEARANEAAQAEAEIADKVALLPRGSIGSLQRFIAGGEREWCEQFDAVQFSLEKVRTKWGAGEYIVNWRKPDPKTAGRGMVGAGSTRFQIAAEKDAATATPITSADARGSLALATLAEEHVKRMLDGQQLLQQMQMAVLKNLTEPRKDNDLIEKILLALVTRQQQPAGPGLAELVTLADKLSNRTSPGAAIKDTLELLEKARELGGEGGDGSPAWMGVAAKALDVIGRAVSRPALPPGETAPASPDDAAVATIPNPAPEPTTLPPTAHAIFHFLAPHIPALLRHATLDHDPSTYAGVIFDQLQPEYLSEVRDYVGRPDFLDLLEAHFPALRGAVIQGTEPPEPVREWFRALRDDLVERIHETLEPPPAPSEPEVH
jgi:hypothetical protein